MKSSDQCSVPPSLHVDLKVSRPRPFLLSSLANTLLDVAHHTYRVPSAKGYAIPKGFPWIPAVRVLRRGSMARATPCALLPPLALRYAHRVGNTPASAPLRRPLTAYGGSSHSFTCPYTAHGLACATSPFGIVLTTVRFHPLSVLSVPGCRPF